jgi:hypothetical protein
MLELKVGQFVKLTGTTVKGENDIYVVESNWHKNDYTLNKVKLDGTPKESGYRLYFYNEKSTKNDPNMKIEIVTDLKKAKKEVNEYLKNIESQEIVVTYVRAESQEIKKGSIIRFVKGLKFGTFGEKYIGTKSFWKVDFNSSNGLYIKRLGKKGQELSLLNDKNSYSFSKNLTDLVINEYIEVVEKIETRKGDIIKETKKVAKKEIKPVQETITEVEKVEESQQEVSNAQETQTINNSIEFTVSEDIHTKTGKKIFVAKLTRTLSKVEYININIRIKSLGGYYSSFKKGFLFDNEPTELLQNEFNTTIDIIEPTQEVQEPKQEIIINETLAKRAKENMSFYDYKEGSATAEYNQVVENIANKINEAKEKVSDELKIKLDYLLNKFKKDYANWTNKKNANGSSHVSVMISGASNYNMNKHNKYVSREDKLWQEYNNIMSIDDKIQKIINSSKIIKSTDKNALDKLKEKLEQEEKQHQEIKDYNKQARKEGKEVYPAYMLSNSNQRIKNIKDRISHLEKLEELKKIEPSKEIEINGIKIIDNLEANRLQMIFDGKPDENTRKLLKSNGFRWSPTQGAWQRFRSPEAERKAKIIAESLKDNNDNIAM